MQGSKDAGKEMRTEGNNSKDRLLAMVRGGEALSAGQQIRLAFALGLPAILAQVSSVMMQYIDASMVGRLGAEPSAAIGLVSTSTWITGGFAMGLCSGFSVQIAQHCGARRFASARKIVRQGLLCVLLFSLVLLALGVGISAPLPRWLGGGQEILADASGYFRIYSLFVPFMALSFAGGGMLQASGDMKIPSILNVGMCVLDVIFNYIFIFRMGMGVRGAALGTGLAEALTCAAMLYFLSVHSKELAFLRGAAASEKDSEPAGEEPQPLSQTISRAMKVTGPMWLQNVIMRGAYVMSTLIVAPLGAISIAANAFAITAESFCYMPGYGLEEAATSLVGQSIGAKRKDLARRFAFICTGAAALMMTFLGALMFIFSESLMGLLSTDAQIVALGAKVLRIEAFAETFYAVSIVGYGACIGAGDTIIPTILNFASMWIVRIGLAALLTPTMGLTGYWIAMCIELNVRGVLFALRLRGRKWMEYKLTQ